MSYLKSRIEIFRFQPFRYYLISCTVAMFGNGLTYVAMAWALLQGQNDVRAIAILMACFWIPTVVFGPFMGVLVDKFSRQRLILFANTVRLFALLAFWWFAGQQPSNLSIYLLATIIGTMMALYIPAAMAFVREIVPQQDLLAANATVDSAYEIGNIVGMGLAGLVIAWVSIEMTFLINAVFYAFSCITMLMIDQRLIQSNVTEKPASGFISDLKDGTRYLLSNKNLLFIYSVQMLIFVCYMTTPILLAPFAKSILFAQVREFGILEALASVGIVLGGFFSPYFVRHFPWRTVLLVEILFLLIAFYLFSHTRLITMGYVWYLMIGFFFSVWPLLMTEAQDNTELDFQGRVHSLFNCVSGILILSVYGLMTFIGDSFSVADLYWAEIIFAAIALTIMFIYKKT